MHFVFPSFVKHPSPPQNLHSPLSPHSDSCTFVYFPLYVCFLESSLETTFSPFSKPPHCHNQFHVYVLLHISLMLFYIPHPFLYISILFFILKFVFPINIFSRSFQFSLYITLSSSLSFSSSFFFLTFFLFMFSFSHPFLYVHIPPIFIIAFNFFLYIFRYFSAHAIFLLPFVSLLHPRLSIRSSILLPFSFYYHSFSVVPIDVPPNSFYLPLWSLTSLSSSPSSSLYLCSYSRLRHSYNCRISFHPPSS